MLFHQRETQLKIRPGFPGLNTYLLLIQSVWTKITVSLIGLWGFIIRIGRMSTGFIRFFIGHNNSSSFYNYGLFLFLE